MIEGLPQYPKTLYPRIGGGSITVTSAEQEKRMGDGWVHHPPFVQEDPHVLSEAEVKVFESGLPMEPVQQPKKRGRPKKEVPLEAT